MPNPSRLDLGERPRILVIRRDNIGDLVLTTPTVSLLRQRYPNAYLAALVNSYNAAVLRGNPELDEVFAYTKAKHLDASESRIGAWLGQWRLMREIRRRGFDLAIVATAAPTPKWLRLARASGARHILAAVAPDAPVPRGVDLPVVRDAAFEGRHAAERTALLLTALGIDAPPPKLTLRPDAQAAAQAREAWRAGGLGGRPLRVGVHISARKARQSWPAERFPALMRALHEATGCAFALFWSPGAADDPRHPGDDEKAAAIVAAADGLPLRPVPTHTLDRLIAELSAVDLVICSDGGAMHLAAALDKAIVCFFGNSDPATWRPWGAPHRVLRPASETAADVTGEQALEAAIDLLQATGAIARPAQRLIADPTAIQAVADRLHAALGAGLGA